MPRSIPGHAQWTSTVNITPAPLKAPLTATSSTSSYPSPTRKSQTPTPTSSSSINPPWPPPSPKPSTPSPAPPQSTPSTAARPSSSPTPPRPRTCRSGALRVERQQMRGRQPFWHRNVDVDELSFQCAGERTLLTELGSCELRAGDWSRIPRRGGARQLREGGGALAVLRARGGGGLWRGGGQGGGDGEYEWMYKAKEVWIGAVTLRNCSGEAYRRHRKADEIQCQISGRRLLVSRRGAVEPGPGDFVCAPKGCAFTSIAEESFHTSVLTTQEAPMKAEVARTAEVDSAGLVRDARERVKKNMLLNSSSVRIKIRRPSV